ncbi:PREDICTED: cytidine and dCMP deaminase domain-containing protein 1-like [Acropora digitifera]|uniref:cytidine and dCMP deaminase domain-containing protein 1-like n=1 Tax=Acropora digitifera TaxID=70779 RepID=UPI00077A46CE|nr:PREDICTED: cytidine and dCMP deaminase domain-containing protein 1-like [Acropora digitifera]
MANSSYATTNPRVSKHDLYMILALWMERFPDGEQSEDPLYKKVGAVLVLPNDISYAIDCSRDGVHAVARLIMGHPNIPEGCKVFVSRKPCSRCTKLLVQAKVERVFYLPIEPEYFPRKGLNRKGDKRRFQREKCCVDNLFKVSPISQNIFVPKVGSEIVENAETRSETPEEIRNKTFNDLMKKYWNKWMNGARQNLPWPSFDKDTKSEVKEDFENMMKWMATIYVESEERYSFELKRKRKQKDIIFNPLKNTDEREQAYHLIILAKFLAERTDDPRAGVGAVILSKKKTFLHSTISEIVGLGWNGFPKKTRYGEFARASDEDESVQNKKYPYIIHAEQNALMMRNTKNIEGGTLFVTKTPCNECTPLIEIQGIETVVLNEDPDERKKKERKKKSLGYEKFLEGIKSDKFSCFYMKMNQGNAKRKLSHESEKKQNKKARRR